MAVFRTPVDIGRRACQHCGVRRIDSFADDSVPAGEISTNYDQLRVAELRRNLWRFAIRKAPLRPVSPTSVQLSPAPWDIATGYIIGSVVTYNDVLYISREMPNTALAPDSNPTAWEQYFGPMVFDQYDSDTTYYAGDIVYTPATTGYGVYLSLQSDNADDPTIVPEWDSTILYSKGQTVRVTSPVFFLGSTVYFNGVAVVYSTPVYQSKVDLNIGATPVSNPAVWQTIPGNQDTQMFGQKWLKLDADVAAVRIVYPLGTGPTTQAQTRNVFVLPSGYLREAPQDPKAGSVSYLGAPSNRGYDDWQFESGYIVSRENEVILFRFGADVSDVTRMDPMFCELLGARVGLEICERVTQSTAKVSVIEAAYAKFGTEARTVNGIETGSVEAATDDFLTARL